MDIDFIIKTRLKAVQDQMVELEKLIISEGSAKMLVQFNIIKHSVDREINPSVKNNGGFLGNLFIVTIVLGPWIYGVIKMFN